MSRDRGTSKQAHDFGYGQPCTLDGATLGRYVLADANQEHGILSAIEQESDTSAPADDVVVRFPVGTKLRILPNHACATGAQFSEYHALSPAGGLSVWRRFGGW